MTLEGRSVLVLAAAKALYVNGQSTERTLAAAGRLAEGLGLRVTILARWGELALQANGGEATLVRAVAADPTGVHMGRVAAITRVIDKAAAAQLSPDDARTQIETILKTPPAPTWFFHHRRGGWRRGVERHLWSPTPRRCRPDCRERRRRRNPSARYCAIERQYLPAAALRGHARGRRRRLGGPLRTQLVATAGRSLPLHDPRARASCAQRRPRSPAGPYPSRRNPDHLRQPRGRCDLDRAAVRPGAVRRRPAGSIPRAARCRYGRTWSRLASPSPPTASSSPRP